MSKVYNPMTNMFENTKKMQTKDSFSLKELDGLISQARDFNNKREKFIVDMTKKLVVAIRYNFNTFEFGSDDFNAYEKKTKMLGEELRTLSLNSKA